MPDADLPLLFVDNRLPNSKDHDLVSITQRHGPHATTPFLLNVPLWKARLIVRAIDLLRTIEHHLADVKEGIHGL